MRCMDGAYREQRDILARDHLREINIFYWHIVNIA